MRDEFEAQIRALQASLAKSQDEGVAKSNSIDELTSKNKELCSECEK